MTYKDGLCLNVEIRVRRSFYFGIVMESDKGELYDYIRDHFEISPVKLKI